MEIHPGDLENNKQKDSLVKERRNLSSRLRNLEREEKEIFDKLEKIPKEKAFQKLSSRLGPVMVEIDKVKEELEKGDTARQDVINSFMAEEESSAAEINNKKVRKEKIVESAKEALGIREWFRKKFSSKKETSTKLEPEKDKEKEEENIQRAIEKLPKSDREKLGFGLNRMGLSLEQKKNEFFAKTFGWIAKTNLDQNKTTTSWLRKMSENFDTDAEAAHKKAKDVKEGKAKHRVQNVGRLAGNILKIGRIFTDAVGYTAAMPLRYVMLAGATIDRGFEAGKEVRFDNPELIEQTRLDIEKATNEAWNIYTRAQEKAGKAGEENVSVEELKTGYLAEMPKDLQKRLGDPEIAYGTIQGLFQKQITFSVNRLNDLMEKIDNSTDLKPKEKEAKKDRILKKWEKSLNDYDRALTQVGTIDELAMGARYAQMAGKGLVGIATIQTIFIAGEKLLVPAWHALVDSYDHGILAAAKDAMHFTNTPTKDFLNSALTKNTGENMPLPKDAPHVGITPSAMDATTHTMPLVKETIIHPLPGQGSATPGITENLPEAGHELTQTMEFKVQGPLEHAYEKLVLNHLAHTNLDQGHATRALNEAANMVRLTEGHNTAGITVEEFNKAFSYHDGVLKILDPKAADHIMDRLHGHSGELVDMFKNDPNSATGYIKGVDWHDRELATGMNPTATEPGIVGHPDATIDDFSHIPNPHEVITAEARARVLESMEGKSPTVELTSNGELIDHMNNVSNHSVTAEELIKYTPEHHADSTAHIMSEKAGNVTPYNSPQDPGTGSGVNTTGEGYRPYNSPNGNIFDTGHTLSIDMIKEVNRISTENIYKLFPENSQEVWDAVKDGAADDMMLNKPEEGLERFFAYMHKLQDLTDDNVKPLHE
ncbi:MAG: hypothetical protein ABIS26_01475, partial [Candidatus Paceibacterota bacterium]